MSEQAVIEMLDRLAEMRALLDLLRIDKQALVDKALEPIRDELDAIDTEFGEQMADLDKGIQALEGVIRDTVKQQGETVRGKSLMAVHVTSVRWNRKGLEALAVEHPSILSQRTESVSIQIRSR